MRVETVTARERANGSSESRPRRRIIWPSVSLRSRRNSGSSPRRWSRSATTRASPRRSSRTTCPRCPPALRRPSASGSAPTHGEGGTGTAVETTEKVDLEEKARAPAQEGKRPRRPGRRHRRPTEGGGTAAPSPRPSRAPAAPKAPPATTRMRRRRHPPARRRRPSPRGIAPGRSRTPRRGHRRRGARLRRPRRRATRQSRAQPKCASSAGADRPRR
jgi:hypothetical protein